jgi:hypothetical protein
VPAPPEDVKRFPSEKLMTEGNIADFVVRHQNLNLTVLIAMQM